MADQDGSQRLLMGRIGAAHGIKGEVRIQSFTEEPLALVGLRRALDQPAGAYCHIERARATTNVLVARLKGVDDRTAAEKLNGVELYVDARAAACPVEDEDDFYLADLIGLEARVGDGRLLGTVHRRAELRRRRHPRDRRRAGETALIPFTRAAVPEVRIGDGLPRHRAAGRDRGRTRPKATGRRGCGVSWRADIVTLFPELFPGPLGASVIGRGLGEGLWSLNTTNLRDFAVDKYRTVDDTPAGGGPGMVLKPDILATAIDAVSPAGDVRPRLLMSPRGTPLTQARVRQLAAGPGAVIVCGRFEGVDQRVIEARNLEEISIGDYVLAGGEVAAMVLLEAVVRLIPGVLGAADSPADESFEHGLLEYPHYTRPQMFEGREIPAVLISGDHGKVETWRREESRKLTQARRPDLLK